MYAYQESKVFQNYYDWYKITTGITTIIHKEVDS